MTRTFFTITYIHIYHTVGIYTFEYRVPVFGRYQRRESCELDDANVSDEDFLTLGTGLPSKDLGRYSL